MVRNLVYELGLYIRGVRVMLCVKADFVAVIAAESLKYRTAGQLKIQTTFSLQLVPFERFLSKWNIDIREGVTWTNIHGLYYVVGSILIRRCQFGQKYWRRSVYCFREAIRLLNLFFVRLNCYIDIREKSVIGNGIACCCIEDICIQGESGEITAKVKNILKTFSGLARENTPHCLAFTS